MQPPLNLLIPAINRERETNSSFSQMIILSKIANAMKCIRILTNGRQIAILAVHQEQIDGNLLARAFESMPFVEIGGWTEMLNLFC